MFVRRKEFNELQNELRKLKQHVGKLTTETERNTDYGKRNSRAIEKLKQEIDVDDGYIHFYSIFQRETPKPFNLSQKVDAILKHLGLVESIELGNKLVPAPKKSKKEAKQ